MNTASSSAMDNSFTSWYDLVTVKTISTSSISWDMDSMVTGVVDCSTISSCICFSNWIGQWNIFWSDSAIDILVLALESTSGHDWCTISWYIVNTRCLFGITWLHANVWCCVAGSPASALKVWIWAATSMIRSLSKWRKCCWSYMAAQVLAETVFTPRHFWFKF